jgi:magnesium-transporting ATPase (P-type)
MRIANTAIKIGATISTLASIVSFILALVFLLGDKDVAGNSQNIDNIVGVSGMDDSGILSMTLSAIVLILAIASFFKNKHFTLFVLVIIFSAALLIISALTMLSTVWLASLIALIGGVIGVLGVNRRNRLSR